MKVPRPPRKPVREQAAGGDEAGGADAADPSAMLDAMKTALRKEIAARLAPMKRLARAQKTRSLAAYALRSPPLGGHGLVLAYRALPDEPCVDALVESLVARGWRVAFPQIDATGTMRLVELATGPGRDPVFHPSRWTTDRYGIRAPRADDARARPVWSREIDAVLVPGRAFDQRGNRLGRGKGYYDRLIARLRPDARGSTVGIAFAEQLAESVPVSDDDRRVTWIATDRGLMRARR